MKRIKLLIVLLGCFVFIGCSTVKNVGTIAGTGTVVYGSFDDVYQIIENNMDIFSVRDIVKLKEVSLEMLAVKEKLDVIIANESGAMGVAQNIHDLMPLYNRAAVSYAIAESVIMPRIGEFSKADQVTLVGFDTTCKKLNASIVDATEGTENTKEIIDFIFFVGKVVIPLVLI